MHFTVTKCINICCTIIYLILNSYDTLMGWGREGWGPARRSSGTIPIKVTYRAREEIA